MSDAAPSPSPLAALHPAHLAVRLPALGPGAVARLRDCPRLSARLLAMVMADLPVMLDAGEPTERLPEERLPEERLALADAETVARAGLLMGALWHGHAIRQCIDAQAIAALDASIGRAARLFGLRAASGVTPDAPVPAAALGAAVLEDGQRCLARWRDALPEPYRRLAALRLPLHGMPDPAPAERADPVIACVARELAFAG